MRAGEAAKVRLIGRDAPVLSQPRVVRFAGFMGTGLAELDFLASHGQQIYKYAVNHGLPRNTLEMVFCITASIKAFRQHPDLGVSAAEAKRIVNLLVYIWEQWQRLAVRQSPSCSTQTAVELSLLAPLIHPSYCQPMAGERAGH